jgi:hypothetical protein
VHRPHLFERDLSQMVELGPRRRESMFLALPVMGLYIFPAMVGLWWIDWTRWVRMGV